MTASTQEWFDVTQGLRQGCVLSPLMLSVLFADATHVVLVRFSEDEDIVRDLVHLEEDAVVGKEGGHVVRRRRRNCLEVGGGTR